MPSAASSGGTGSSNGRETRDDRRGRDAGALEACCRARPGRPADGRGALAGAPALRLGAAIGLLLPSGAAGGVRRPVGIARPALAINLARGSDRAGQQLRRVAAARAEIERDDAGTNGDEAQHLLRLAAQIVGAIGRAAIGARHDLRDLIGPKRRRTLLGRRRAGAQEQAHAEGDGSQEIASSDSHWLSFALGARSTFTAGPTNRTSRGRSARKRIGIRRQIHEPNLARQSQPFHRRTKVSRDGLQCSFDDAWLTARFQAVYRAGPHWYGPPRRGRGWPFCRFRSTT